MYVQDNKSSLQLEAVLNRGLNAVLKSLPQDPLSLLAATLIDVILEYLYYQASPCYPIFEKFHAKETLLAPDVGITKTMKITVFIAYQGKTLPYYTYVQPLNPESEGSCASISDFKEACRLINEEISPLIKGKDVLALKKIDDLLLNFQKKKAEQDPPV